MEIRTSEENEDFRIAWIQTKDIKALEEYVISETLSPICDYENAVNIIRDNYKNLINIRLLIIGADLSSSWIFHKKNEMLCMLNCMYEVLPNVDKAIIDYLNAYDIAMRDKEYQENPYYEEYLLKSVATDVVFVKNRIALARLYATRPLMRIAARELLNQALTNVLEICTETEISTFEKKHFVDANRYINEFILGTTMSEYSYNALKSLLKELE